MNLGAIFIAFAFMLLVMTGAWLAQRVTRNVGWVDVFWTYGTGIAGTVLAVWPSQDNSPWRRVFVAILIIVWSLRLGTHVAVRVLLSEEDSRYQSLRKQWGDRFQSRLFMFLVPQAVVTALLGVSIMAASHRPGQFGLVTDVLGGLVLIIGIAGETVADDQLRRFKHNQERQGSICNVGLWSWSRHPNYFFEWFCWLAYPVIALGSTAFWPTIIAPIVMYLVLVHGTGVPPVEQQMARSRGAEFDRYKARTSTFFPLPPRS